VETALAATVNDRFELKNEASDLMYHLLVLLQDQGLDLSKVIKNLKGINNQILKEVHEKWTSCPTPTDAITAKSPCPLSATPLLLAAFSPRHFSPLPCQLLPLTVITTRSTALAWSQCKRMVNQRNERINTVQSSE
jgi:hypothetical protein